MIRDDRMILAIALILCLIVMWIEVTNKRITITEMRLDIAEKRIQIANHNNEINQLCILAMQMKKKPNFWQRLKSKL